MTPGEPGSHSGLVWRCQACSWGTEHRGHQTRWPCGALKIGAKCCLAVPGLAPDVPQPPTCPEEKAPSAQDGDPGASLPPGETLGAELCRATSGLAFYLSLLSAVEVVLFCTGPLCLCPHPRESNGCGMVPVEVTQGSSPRCGPVATPAHRWGN